MHSDLKLSTKSDSDVATAPTVLDLSVIIPTFREVENLPILIPRLTEALTAAGLNAEILVIDDDSQDGTEMLCKELALQYPVRLIIRTSERGLASAVVLGLKEARGEVLAVMDADLSHPPEKVPDLVRALRLGGADFVIGSRYILGGRTDEKWGWFRWLNSKVATLLARPLTLARDPMAGFFALSRASYQKAADRLDPIGYKIGLELIVKSGCRNIAEVPIEFCDRTKGTSKLNFRQQLDYLRHLARLYLFRLTSRP